MQQISFRQLLLVGNVVLFVILGVVVQDTYMRNNITNNPEVQRLITPTPAPTASQVPTFAPGVALSELKATPTPRVTPTNTLISSSTISPTPSTTPTGNPTTERTRRTFDYTITQPMQYVNFSAIWNQVADVDFEMIDPDGIHYTLQNYQSLRSYEEEIYWSKAETYYVMRFYHPKLKVGTWHIIYYAPPEIEPKFDGFGRPMN